MPVLDILGIPVAFPYAPYACQQDFMQEALKALRDGENALLESPTGTGKTACLLCSALSWQTALKSRNTLPDNPNSSNVPRVYYASRTHSQLAQVVRELKKTAYTPRMVVLGSREQSCCHPRVAAIKGAAQSSVCMKLVTKESCLFRKRVDKALSSFCALGPKEQIVDLEELGGFVKNLGACPFFASRDLLNGAELVLLPYSYLLDKRSFLNLDFRDAVVIFDEAHNIVPSVPSCLGKLLHGCLFI